MQNALEQAVTNGAVPALLRDSEAPPFAMPRLPAEYSNWMDEQLSWRRSVCLYDQSHHMTDLTLKGEGVIPLLRSIAVNDFTKFPVDTAKQYVAVNHRGYIIGDAIIFHLEEDEYRIVGGPVPVDWAHFHAQTRGIDIEISRDDNSYVRKGDPEYYRYQIQGPKAFDVMRDVLGTEPPQLKFFAMGRVEIAGKQVRALRHGMAGEPGYELFGPWQDGDAVRQALLEAGARYDIRMVGGLAYLTNAIDGGWIPRPLPAIFEDEPLLNEFRAWQASAGGQLVPSLGGSLYSEDVEDYYFTLYELGYGRVVRFDHDFIGREALEQQVAEGRDKARAKVTLVWNAEDATKVFASIFEPGVGAKFPNLPMPLYSTFQYDTVLADSDGQVGRAAWTGYSANERAMLSLATIDSEFAEPGTEVTLLWGEDLRSRKPTVEEHKQFVVRAMVAPAPIGEYARENYRKS